MLLIAAFYAFGAARMVLYEAGVLLQLDTAHSFQCGQSILINGGALLLAFWALGVSKAWHRDRLVKSRPSRWCAIRTTTGSRSLNVRR